MFDFSATGSQVKFQGFMKVYVEGDDDKEEEKDRILPPLEKGEQVKYEDIEPKQHFTQPPPRYTEARLVRTLEELGIGDHQHLRQHLIQFKNGDMLH